VLAVAAVAAVAVLMSVTEGVVDELRQSLHGKYMVEYEIAPGYFTLIIDETRKAALTKGDLWLLEFCDTAYSVLAAAIPIGALLLTVFGFYRLKLRKPLMELAAGAARIAENDLDFSFTFQSKDEMGRLCASFEAMRVQLVENNRTTWRAMEESRRINAAFAHDLRTPLTVLKGYIGLLCAYDGQISPEKRTATLNRMSEAVDRLSDYVQTMQEAQRTEAVKPQAKPVPAGELAKKLKDCVCALGEAVGKTCVFTGPLEGTVFVDEGILFRVLENLVSNGLRYAKGKVCVCLRREEDVCLEVSDDGPGFSQEALARGAEAFFRSDTSKEDGHMGLGLYICSLLCERCGGELRLSNPPDGGGCVEAVFRNCGK